MRSTIGQLLIAVALAAAGLVLFRASDLEHRLAAAERDLVTLRYHEAGARAAEPPPPLASWLPGSTGTAQTAKELQLTSRYWEGDYTALASDPDAKLLAANAAYRALRKEGGTWQAVTGRLDGIVKNYADVLRQDPGNLEAAYNFEFVARVRGVVAARRQNLAPMDLQALGLTIHGGAGAPPAEAEAKKFKMIIPMRPDERMEAEKAGKGATRVRKG
jgi:hypothetical protein